jgi:hypothetical protein
LKVKTVMGVALAALALVGCVEQQMNQGLPKLAGHDIHDAFRVLGYPSSHGNFAGDIVYTWRTDGTVAFPVTNYATTTTNVNGAPVVTTTATPRFIPMTLWCQIQLATNEVGRIITWTWQGNRGGCRPWASALNQLP